MARKKTHDDAGPWDRITQATPGAKTRFDPMIVPELIAWLELRKRRYTAVVTALATVPERDRSEYTRQTIRYNEIGQSICEELMSQLSDKWSRNEWNEIVAAMDAAMRAAVPVAAGAASAGDQTQE